MYTTILLVDDHNIVRKALRDWLELEISHCRVIEAGSGEEALQLAQSDHPQLVIMDITLPGISGIEATRRIKATVPSTPIVMFTVHEDEIYRAEAKAAGACAYVPKRMMQTELIARITTLLNQV